ncbi:MAG TPA: AAA family ATPase [Trinickia sp.]|uniref:AAA family ATPase n=1 Tax=Trinickia sp. TaxID=2571163 RepID=UPI002B5ED332|nr:AAA family ATPase [Trinickia sp.]HVW53974.1 AAA family ATPase [Trinickia sp.]
MPTFDPFQADVKIFAGRRDLVIDLAKQAVNRRCVLLFGGRQSGKTTLLRKVHEALQRSVHVDRFDTFTCPVYVDLTGLPVDAKPSDFFAYLLSAAVETCKTLVDGFPANIFESNVCSTIEEFASKIRSITNSTGNVDLTVLFLIDESERVLGERFPRGFQDNLFSILYGAELADQTKIGMVFAGAQQLFVFSEDETSPIGSRAAYRYLPNLSKEDVDTVVKNIESIYSISIDKTVASELFSITGGQAGLTVRLYDFVHKNKVDSSQDLSGSLADFRADCRQLLRLWAAALSKQARALHDELAVNSKISNGRIVAIFKGHGWDPMLAEKAIDEIVFTGVGKYEDGILSVTNEIYWAYARDFIFPDETPPMHQGGFSDESSHDAIWSLIESAEIGLRSYVNLIYEKRFGGVAVQAKIRQALGPAAMDKVLANVSKSNTRYKYTPRDESLDIFDGLYLGQLGQLITWKEAWPAFSHLAQDKREIEILLAPINAVRTDKAHFYRVPIRELTRCKLHCEDLIFLIDKHRPNDAL